MSRQPLPSSPAGIEVEDVLIASDTPDIQLFLRNKRRASVTPSRSILLVHGATFPSVSLFDVDVDGFSFMDALAGTGLDVWALDVRGYGGSSRPAPMSGKPEAGTPLVTAIEAERDVARAVEHIRQVRSIDVLTLLGMSWGGSVAGLYASRHPDRLDALVLVAPLWLSSKPLRFDAGGEICSHRLVTVDAFKAAWLAAAPEERRDDLLPAGLFERWSAVTSATDPALPEGTIRAPGGAVADVRHHWTAGHPLYDPTAITAPTLIVRGEWDVDVRRDMAADLFDRLTGTPRRASIEIGGGTHMILMEPSRDLVLDGITSFMERTTAKEAAGPSGIG